MTSLVTLTGPPPWGFRLSGGLDFRRVLTISKVYASSKAELADLRVGDMIVEINGENAARMLHVQAHNSIKNSGSVLTLLINRPNAAIVRQPPQDLTVSPRKPASQKTTLTQKVSEVRRDGWPDSEDAQCSHTVEKQTVMPAGSSPNRKTVKIEGQPENTQSVDVTRQPPLLTPEVLKGIRLKDTPPRQSNTFNLIQEVLEQDCRQTRQGKTRDETSSSALQSRNLLPFFRVQRFRSCESCGTLIVTQAVKISEGRYRHQECYTCQDCGLTLLKRGHFWVGEHLYCGKHASLRYQSSR